MTFDLQTYLALFSDTLRDPRGLAQRMIALRVPHPLIWTALALVIVLTVLLMHAELMITGATSIGGSIGGAPMADAIILGALSAVMVFVIYLVGLSMGGSGSFGATLLLVTWLHAIVLGLLMVQVVIAFVAPALLGTAVMIGLGIQLWCLVHFIDELHGFDSLFKSIAVLIVGCFGIAVGLALMIVTIGGVAAVGG